MTQHRRYGYDGRPISHEPFTGTEPQRRTPRSSSGMTYTIFRNWLILAGVIGVIIMGVTIGLSDFISSMHPH